MKLIILDVDNLSRDTINKLNEYVEVKERILDLKKEAEELEKSLSTNSNYFYNLELINKNLDKLKIIFSSTTLFKDIDGFASYIFHDMTLNVGMNLTSDKIHNELEKISKIVNGNNFVLHDLPDKVFLTEFIDCVDEILKRIKNTK